MSEDRTQPPPGFEWNGTEVRLSRDTWSAFLEAAEGTWEVSRSSMSLAYSWELHKQMLALLTGKAET